ncbi:DUF411 domain-containing protein [Microvirga sp. VF16]|uniref:DUF411 domain-containing protein n=1 Tax=Microvirga sp. VF16 TaxID=2807101 RepID=UPI00193E9638|nr:DUF411 domain-containing protein [Microvirga sp. VF16]QRM34699.1 DUF411 domain-containing protein [Microvirga sp. VF16]
MRILNTAIAALTLTLAGPALAAETAKQATLYKNPQCSCCEEYAKYLRESGFDVKVVMTHDLPLIRKEHGVPADLEGCHTTLVGNYVVEGHVPLTTLNRLLTERPAIKGISLPGMPMGSPGMAGRKVEPFTMYEISGDATPKVYAVE